MECDLWAALEGFDPPPYDYIHSTSLSQKTSQHLAPSLAAAAVHDCEALRPPAARPHRFRASRALTTGRPSCFGHSVGREKGLCRGSKPRHPSAHFGPGLGIRNEVLACHCLTIHAPTTTIVIAISIATILLVLVVLVLLFLVLVLLLTSIIAIMFLQLVVGHVLFSFWGSSTYYGDCPPGSTN